MPEIIIKIPYKKINMPRNCCHCGSYNASVSIDVSRPVPQTIEVEREGGNIIRKTRRLNVPAYLCEDCNQKLKKMKKLSTIISITSLICVLFAIWYFVMPIVYSISQEYKGHAAGLLFFFLGLFSLVLIFIAIGITALKVNHFIGFQILVYNMQKIIIRFYNKDFAQKFFDLNNVKDENIIKNKL